MNNLNEHRQIGRPAVAPTGDEVKLFEFGGLLMSVSLVTQSARQGGCGQLRTALRACLADLSVVVGASRSCLCVVDPRGSVENVITSFVGGGSEDVPALGPSFLGVRVDEIPEWRRSFEEDRPSIVRAADEVSPIFRSVLDSANLDWVISVPLTHRDRPFATLSLLGRGDTAILGERHLHSLGAFAEILTAVLLPQCLGFESVGAPTSDQQPELQSPQACWQAHYALDLIDLGVMWIDQEGRCFRSNVAAQRLLDDPADRAEPRLLPDVNISLDDGTDLSTALWESRNGPLRSSNEVPVRITTHAGKTMRGKLIIRNVDPDDVSDGGERLITFCEPFALAPETAQAGTGSETKSLTGYGLTSRDVDVIALLLQGHRVSTIAVLLYVSPHTVRNRLKSIFRKTGVHSQAELVRIARAGSTDLGRT